MSAPTLVEPGMRMYVDHTMKLSNAVKQRNSVMWYNVAFAIVLVLVVGGFLLSKYRGKQTPYEKACKDAEGRHYVLSKLQRLAAVKSRESGGSITGLPTWGADAALGSHQVK